MLPLILITAYVAYTVWRSNAFLHDDQMMSLAKKKMDIKAYILDATDMLRLSRLWPKQPEKEMAALNKIGEGYREQGQYEKAEQFYQQALAKSITLYGNTNNYAGIYLNNLGQLYYQDNKLNEAESAYTLSRNIMDSLYGKSSVQYAMVTFNIGDLRFKSGKTIDAERLYKQAIHIFEQSKVDDRIFLLVSYRKLGEYYAKLSDWNQAQSQYSEAYDLLCAEVSADTLDYEVMELYDDYSGYYLAKKNYTQAEMFLSKALNIGRSSFGSTSIYYLKLLAHEENLNNVEGDYSTAKSIRTKIQNISNELSPDERVTINDLYK